MKNRKDFLWIAFIFVAAFLLRWIYMIFLKQHYFFNDFPSSDVLYYQRWADEILGREGGGQKAFWGLPLYPYFLAVIKALTFNNNGLVRTGHLLLGACNSLLVFYVADKLFSKRVAYLASILTATNFIFIYYDWLMMPVTLLITLSLLLVIVLIHVDISSPRKEWFLLGLLIGLAAAGDGKFLIFGALLTLYLARSRREEWRRVCEKIILPLILGMSLIPGMITARNKLVSGDAVLISAQSGLSFYVGNNRNADGIYKNPDFLRPTHDQQDEDQKIVAEQILKRRLSPGEVSGFWYRRAFKFIRTSPQQYFSLLLKKAAAILTENESAYEIDLLLQREWKNAFDINPFRIMCPMALIGLGLTLRSHKRTVAMNLLLISQVLFTLIFFLTDRHRATILPFLIIYEAYVAIWLLDQLKARNVRNMVGFLIIMLSLSFLFRPVRVNADFIDFLRLSKSGPILVERGEYQEAERHYHQALKLQPHDANTLYNLGTLYALQNNFARAAEEYDRALKINPYDPSVHYNLGYCYQKLSKNDFAKDFYRKTIALQPESADAHLQMAQMYEHEGNCLMAEEHYRRIINIAPRFSHEIQGLIQRCQPKRSATDY